MRILINNTVKTETSDYTFPTREEAEAFYMSLRVERGEERPTGEQHAAAENPPTRKRGKRQTTH
jgi:hypothetical protein